MKHDSTCDWAVHTYQKLMDGLDKKQIITWYSQDKFYLHCTDCRVERGCCKKRKLMLAMTSQILDWLKRHKQELSDVDFGDDKVKDDESQCCRCEVS